MQFTAKFLFLFLAVFAIIVPFCNASKREAYITLVYGNTFGLPARVMFQSLKETGTLKELAAVVTPDVDKNSRQKLINLGVTVIDIPIVKNPYARLPHYQERFDKVLSKLYMWNLTEYDTLVSIDADTLVFQNVDELFSCGEFCAAFINPTKFNSGVMVLKPNKQVFSNMMEKLASGLESFDSGDQGFLNSFFPKLLDAPVFDGNLSRNSANATMKRLASTYHSDHLLYYPKLKWDPVKPAVVEFIGLPLLKPWQWWSYAVMDLSHVWNQYRNRLPEHASDRSHDAWIMRVLVLLPLVLIGAAFTIFWHLRSTVSRYMCAFLSNRSFISVHTVTMAAGVTGLFMYLISALLPFYVIPQTAPVAWAWGVWFLWTYSILSIFFGAFCAMCYLAGRYGSSALDRPVEIPKAPFRNSALLGSLLVTYSMVILLAWSHGDYSELFHKISVVVFGVFFGIILHFMVLSRIAFLWFTYGWAKGTHYHTVPSFSFHPWAKSQTLLSVIFANILFLSLVIWALSNSYQTPNVDILPPREVRKFVIISSDDWGRWTDATAIWPNMSYWKLYHDLGIPGTENKMNGWTYATAETACDMREFFDFMEELNMEATKFEHRVVMTPFWTVGGPDMEAMQGLGCPFSPQCEYRELLGDHVTGLQREPFNRGDLKDIYQHGFKKRFWHPEYHARSHFDHKKWLSLMRDKQDTASLACFNFSLVCATVGYDLRSENTMFEDEQQQFEWFQGGVNTFENIWGYRPAVHSSPHNVTGKYLANIVKQLGFIGVDNPIPGAPEDAVSTIDRARFDPFNINFDYEKTWKLLLEELQNKPYLSLAYHAQNSFTSMYTPEQHRELMEIFRKTVRKLREYPGVVFVTSSELHQIRTKGYSMEVWYDGFILRNYSPQPVVLKAKNLKSVYYYGADWSGKSLELVQLSGLENERIHQRTEVGATITLQPNTVYELRIEQN